MLKPTGHVRGPWKEYAERLHCHDGESYFWLRPDGLRLGFRDGGSYYKAGAVPQYHASTPPMYPLWWSGQARFDGARCRQIWHPEDEKRETLPPHLRLMRGETIIEIVERIGLESVNVLNWKDPAEIYEYLAQAWPYRGPKVDGPKPRPFRRKRFRRMRGAMSGTIDTFVRGSGEQARLSYLIIPDVPRLDRDDPYPGIELELRTEFQAKQSTLHALRGKRVRVQGGYWLDWPGELLRADTVEEITVRAPAAKRARERPPVNDHYVRAI